MTTKTNGMARLIYFALVAVGTAPAQGPIVWAAPDFSPSFGYGSYAPFALGPDGNLWGSTIFGSTYDHGAIWNGNLNAFIPLPGSPSVETIRGALAMGTDRNLYGTSFGGGIFNLGTVFSLNPNTNNFSVHSFCGPDLEGCTATGSYPIGALALGTDGNFYGATFGGGRHNEGTLFRVTTTGVITTLHDFCAASNCTDGSNPNGSLVLGPDGNFYGTTTYGGAWGVGSAFRLTTSGGFTLLNSFFEGSYPLGGLTLGNDGNLYGTTSGGGTSNGGMIFVMTTSGAMFPLYSFCAAANCTDGYIPWGDMIVANDGNFYGTTYGGGYYGYGSAFYVTPGGVWNKLYDFCTSWVDSPVCEQRYPSAGIAQGADSNLYGAYSGGGGDQYPSWTGGAQYGSAYQIITQSTAWGGWVAKAIPGAGRANATVLIVGQPNDDADLEMTTKVTFNGTPSLFVALSPSAILTYVPEGATSGPVVVSVHDYKFVTSQKFWVLK